MLYSHSTPCHRNPPNAACPETDQSSRPRDHLHVVSRHLLSRNLLHIHVPLLYLSYRAPAPPLPPLPPLPRALNPSSNRRNTCQVPNGPPHCIAWSPDDASVLVCGSSTIVTRWDVATGSQMRAYDGQHEEAVTGVAWLRDGRGFVTSALDRC